MNKYIYVGWPECQFFMGENSIIHVENSQALMVPIDLYNELAIISREAKLKSDRDYRILDFLKLYTNKDGDVPLYRVLDALILDGNEYSSN